MGTWPWRNASTLPRTLVLIAIGTLLLISAYLLSPPFSHQTTHVDVRPAHTPSPTASAEPTKPTQSVEDEEDEKHAHGLPPIYPKLKIAELALPQHNESLPFPEGKNGRFLRFSNQMWGVGLNNQLFEILLNTEIARRSGRAYVFTPILWDIYAKDDYVEVTDNHLPDSQKIRPARVPLGAFIESPTSGAPWPDGDPTPRSVSYVWYERICPPEKQLRIDIGKVNEEIGVDLKKDQGIIIMDKWAMYLRNLEAKCVNLDGSRIIDFGLMGSRRILSMWPSFSLSPVLTSFKWSPIINGAVEKNLQRLGFSTNRDKRLDVHNVHAVTPDLVTIHVRRSDYARHCKWLAGWAYFEGWNTLEFLPDRYKPPEPPSPFGTTIDSTEPRYKYMLPRCWLEIEPIVKRLNQLKLEYADELQLRRVYITTNGRIEWVDSLKKALLESGWQSVLSSHDLKLTWKESGVDSAIDMEIASRGKVFVGNGFSTFSSTVVSLRLTRGLNSKYIRFW